MGTQSGPAFYCHELADALLPDGSLWVDEWADKHMIIPASTGPSEPGPYRVSRTPFARDIMRALSPEHPARRVVVMGASQLLKTQIGLNWFCALIAGAPANGIWLQPTDALAKRVSDRFDKTAQAVEVVRKRVAARRSRDGRNTLGTKQFQDGTLWILTGRSASNLSEASARYVYADEVDRILRELKGEGDPISLLEKRQSTFGRKAKGYFTSSPTEEGTSRIHELYLQGNQQLCYVPCPHCGEYQTLEWENLHADLTAGHAWYVCSANGCVIEEHHKPGMLAAYEWRSQSPGDGETWSYQISYLYAPLGWDSWLKLAQEHEEARQAQLRGDPEKMQVFWNTRLARVWTVVRQVVRPAALMAKAEPYPRGVAPESALMVTAAVDVQTSGRLELQVVGWGPGATGLEAWIVNTHVVYGDPALPETWRELDEYLTTPLRHASGALLTISAVAVDSGDSAQEVYEFVRPRKRRILGGTVQRVVAIKGASVAAKPILGTRPSKTEYSYRGKPVLGGAEVWLVGTDTAKDWLFNRLALEGQIAIHTSDQFPIEFYEQLLAEAKVAHWERGRKRMRYEPVKRGARNEQLDLVVYNLAAAHLLQLHTYTAERWERIRAGLMQADLWAGDTGPAETKAPKADAPVLAPVKPLVKVPRRPLRTGGGLGREDWVL
jgi:phage terminase large subunit GpA-like protein